MQAFSHYSSHGQHHAPHWQMWSNYSGSVHLQMPSYERQLRALFDFDNRKQEQEETAKNGEDEALLAQALQGRPACNRLRFHWENYSDFSDPKKADKAIKLVQKLNGPRFPIGIEHVTHGQESLFNEYEDHVSRRQKDGIKNGCRKAIERTIEVGRRALASAGKTGIPNDKAESLLSKIDASKAWQY